MWVDRDIDAVMSRTRARPIPAGRVGPDEALAFGVVLSVFSVLVMGLAVNWVAAAILAGANLFYVFVYTMWLKRRTPQNIVIGGAAGAFPPMIGWAAVTGDVSLASIVLFLIIFMWTPPHFWALALYRCRDYARVGVPMLPVVAGAVETRRQILIYSVLLAAVGLTPAFIGMTSPVYLIFSGALGAWFVKLAVDVWRIRADTEEREADRIAKRLFVFSILYLFLIFAGLLAESLWRIYVA
jgi:protoheme IX farnesyltransferase